MQTTDTAAHDLAPHHVAGVAQWGARLPHMTGGELLSLLLRLDRSRTLAQAAQASCRGAPLADTLDTEATRLACLWAMTRAEVTRRMGEVGR